MSAESFQIFMTNQADFYFRTIKNSAFFHVVDLYTNQSISYSLVIYLRWELKISPNIKVIFFPNNIRVILFLFLKESA